MAREERKLVLEDYDLWLRTKFTDVFWFKGHKFEKTKGEGVLVDGGLFTKEEAKELFRTLNSRNPFAKFNAAILMWERNGFLVKIIITLAFVALVLIYFKVRR